MNTEIIKIIEYGLNGDKQKIVDFAWLLAKNTQDESLRRRITRLLTKEDSGLYFNSPVVLDNAAKIKEDTGLYLHFITQDDGIRECEKGDYSGNDYD